jgi:hypothetical protein
MKRDGRKRVIEKERERDRERVTRKRGKKCVTSRQMHRPWEIRLRYHIVIAAGYICRSVGRSAGRPVGRGRTERKRENEVYECQRRSVPLQFQVPTPEYIRHSNYN